jgi:putative transposase
MTNYRRNFVPGGCQFFTVNLAQRKSRLLTDHVDFLRLRATTFLVDS